MRHETFAIGCAAGFGGDRTDSAAPIVETLVARGGAGALIFEMLAERTLALAQLDRRKNPDGGYAPLLESMARPVLRRCLEHGIPIVSNFGAANPRAAARRIWQIAQEQGVSQARIAIVEGDDLSDARGRELLRPHLSPAELDREMISANVYLGAAAIAYALRAGAQVVVTGRVADPSLAVGPAMARFGWSETDWDTLGRATMAGHLLECGAQVTGGYFADPGFKDAPDLHTVGFPIAEVAVDGSFTITKADATGGVVNARTVKEQLLYELHDPAAYLTPDVVADISEAEVIEVEENRVAVTGVRGHPRPETLKATVCFAGGWLGEGEISYAGPNAEARARLAAEIVRRRVGDALRLRFDLIGSLSVFGDDRGAALSDLPVSDARDVRLRVAGVHADRAQVERLLGEVTALYTCGPAGGGGIRTTITPRLSSVSCVVPRELVPATFTFLE
ncbi:MAG TPA: acyclic terpene utilization AtuA family protein [Blastocatellia bacterium]|nr:acyclic terpene utilization AtuA family protein [Blastocatellia bacterium]